MPADTIIGAYFPWLDYKWGFPVGVPVKNALISDVFSQFFVWKYLIIDILKSGQVPLWNIYSLGGTPLLATYHSAAFNPFNVFLFLPKFYGWGIFISLQTFSALLGMYLFLSLFTKNFWARIFGGIVFSISGLMTTWTEFGTGVWAASMLPWIFMFLEKYLQIKKLRYLFFLAIFMVILYLSGHAQLTLYSTTLVSIYLLVKYFQTMKLKSLILPGVFVLLSILICAFQFLPTYQFTKQSIRSNEAYSSSFNYGLNPPYELVKFFSSDFFGNPTTNNYWDSQSYHEQSIFLGTLPFILIISFLIHQFRKKQTNFWMSTFLISIFLGFDSPVTRLIYSLPLPFITYSSAARIFFLTSFSGGILAALALDKLSDTGFLNLTKKVNFYFFGIVIGLLAGFTISIYLTKQFGQGVDASKDLVNFNVTIKNLIVPFMMAIIGLTLVILLKLKPKLLPVLTVAIILISFADLSRYFYKYNPFISQNLVFPSTPITDFLKSQPGIFRIARLDTEIMPPNTWTQYKLESIEGYDPLLAENYGRLFNLVNNTGYESTLSRYRELDNFNPQYLDSLNAKYLLSVKRDKNNSAKGDILDPKIEKYGYKVVFEDKNSVIAQNPNSLERAYFVSKLQSLPTQELLTSIISSKSFDPKKEALVLNSLNISEVTGQGDVEITSYTPNKIEFTTQTKNDEFLIFADTYNDGWKLTRNGIKENIYQTNVALRGVVVPSGKNTFIMEYLPDSFIYGLWLSSASLGVFILILLYSLKKKTI
jgi:hypothetical protein